MKLEGTYAGTEKCCEYMFFLVGVTSEGSGYNI